MKFIVMLLMLIFPFVGQAQTVYGNCQIKNVTLVKLNCYGSAELTNTKINGKLTVHGPLLLQNVQINELELKGPLNANSSTIHGKVSVFGPINANSTQFQNDIVTASNSVTFINSSVSGNINITSKTPALFELKEHSIVNGNVTFTQKAGIIKLSSDSAIRGEIKNGTKE